MWIEVFKAGTQTDSAGNQREWTEADLQSIAAKYNDQQAHEAPVTIGHPLDNSPAYGWVDALKAVGGTLYAKFRDLQSDFVQMVNEKRFPKRSIALYEDGLLRHIGFLGAAPPAVKGMPDPKLTFSAEKTFNALNTELQGSFSEAEPGNQKSKPANNEPVKPAKPKAQTQSFSRQARSAVWGIAPKERGHDDLPAHYQDLLPEHFADPVNLRFPMDKRFMPAVLGTWKREDVRKEYSDKERNIISGRLAKAALHYGYNLTDNAFLEVPPELLSKNQLVKVVNGTAGSNAQGVPAAQKIPQQQQSSSTQISPTKFEEGVMPLDQLQAMLEELLGFASETFGEETANQLAAKIQELQEKYKPQGDNPPAAGTPPAAGAPAMSEQAKQQAEQFAEREKAMQARIDALEMTNRLTQFDQFCERMIAQGSILPPQKDFVMELLAASSSVPNEMNFSEVKNNQRKQVKKNLTAAFQEFIPMLKQISYGEQAPGGGASAGNESASGEFSEAPPERLALHQKVVALQEERQKAGKSITYREALSLVSKEQRNG